MRRLLLAFLLVALPSFATVASAQALWGASSVGMTPSQVLASVHGAMLIPDARRESDVFGTQWTIAAPTILAEGVEGTATFGFDDGSLRVVKIDAATPAVGHEADAQCAALLAVLGERYGEPGARERQVSLGLSLTQAMWLEGTVQVVAFCFGGVDATSFFVGVRQLSVRELAALSDP